MNLDHQDYKDNRARWAAFTARVTATQADRSEAVQEIMAVAAANAARPVEHHEGAAAVADLAARRADLMMDMLALMPPGLTPEGVRDWINARTEHLQGGRLRLIAGADPEQQRRGLIGRATCARWWRRALSKAQNIEREAQARQAGAVWAGRERYITDETMRRALVRREKNAEMLARTEMENENGQVFTLADLSARTVSNPTIRRGELMTRIRGCEEWAEAEGMRGLFLTLTTPSRFHAAHRHGGINEKWEESGRPSPRDGQQWLCHRWALARAALARRGLRVFGFRVAEPHHDGTPHWHGLIWATPRHAARAAAVIRRVWLGEDGDERGAKKYRVCVKALQAGGASGYIAKYIAKGIDDTGEALQLDGHTDDVDGERIQMEQADMFGGGAARVRAWASTWGIRQFQAIGQPPVTVWRELRRVPEAQAAAASERVQGMWAAVNREGARLASWAHYMARQGGAFVGREYMVGMDTETVTHEGRYETIEQARPVGVFDRVALARAYSNRHEWRPRGAWKDTAAAAAVPPWTRVNNCTPGHAPGMVAGVPIGVLIAEKGRLQAWHEVIRRHE